MDSSQLLFFISFSDKTPPSLRGTKKAQMTLSSMGGKKQEKPSSEGTKSEPKSASQKYVEFESHH